MPVDLTGHFLIAMPGMADERFARAVVLMCAHGTEGAMGLVINRAMDGLTGEDLMEQLQISTEEPIELPVRFGGPVEAGRGFVLHSPDYEQEGTVPVAEGIYLTATVEVLKDIAAGHGPTRSVLALGYAGWSPGQLEAELQQNGWLTVAADASLLFEGDLEAKWELAMRKLGVDLHMLSGQAGRA